MKAEALAPVALTFKGLERWARTQLHHMWECPMLILLQVTDFTTDLQCSEGRCKCEAGTSGHVDGGVPLCGRGGLRHERPMCRTLLPHHLVPTCVLCSPASYRAPHRPRPHPFHTRVDCCQLHTVLVPADFPLEQVRRLGRPLLSRGTSKPLTKPVGNTAGPTVCSLPLKVLKRSQTLHYCRGRTAKPKDIRTRDREVTTKSPRNPTRGLLLSIGPLK